MHKGLDKKEWTALFPYISISNDSTKPYVVGTQKNRLTETILLSTHNIGFQGQIRIWGCEILFLSGALILHVHVHHYNWHLRLKVMMRSNLSSPTWPTVYGDCDSAIITLAPITDWFLLEQCPHCKYWTQHWFSAI